MNQPNYTASMLQRIEGLEAVRLRPSMYIGSTDKKGLHHLISEAIDNSLDEAAAGYGSRIIVTLYEDNSVSVEDFGRGIPCDIHPQYGIPGVDMVMTELHTGGKFKKEAYKGVALAGLHGVGISCVNALSSHLNATIYQNGKVFSRDYEKGRPVGDFTSKVYNGSRTGTIVKWTPDTEIFAKLRYDADEIQSRLRELSYLMPKITFEFRNLKAKDKYEIEFYSENGLDDFMDYIATDKQGVYPTKPIHISGKTDDVGIDIAVLYSQEYDEYGLSFCNNVPTREHGKHVEGFKRAFTRVFNKFARDNKILSEKDKNLTGEELNDGILYIVSVKVQEPNFQGQTKEKLTNEEILGPISDFVSDALERYLSTNVAIGKKIVESAIISRRAKEASKKAQDLVRNKKSIGRIPAKLMDCNSKNAKECELFIVEGISAAGPAKQARNSNFQAVYPLQGKPRNADGESINKVLANEELKDLVSVMGCGIVDPTSKNSSFDISKLRYHKIVIATDADEDGHHIRCLMSTFFFRYLRPLVEAGYVYMASPPLFMVEGPRTKIYCNSIEERDAAVKKLGGRAKSPVRFKGLGEMNVEQLRETVINPVTRTIYKLTVEQLAETDRLIRILMNSKQVEARKAYIYQHSDLGFVDDIYEGEE